MSADESGWVGVDLDGTLAYYDKWRGLFHIGEPIPIMVNKVKALLAEGYNVRIFTARVARPEEELPDIVAAVKKWCRQHIGQELEVTCRKDMGMIALYDDRCIQIEKNTGVVLGQDFLKG